MPLARKVRTKRELAEAIVAMFPASTNPTVSSSYAIALEYLGKLPKEHAEYTSQRAGIGVDLYEHLLPDELQDVSSTREALERLPEHVEEHV